MPRTTALAELLRRRREQLGYSRTRAAQLSGVNAATIQAWEQGRVRKPAFEDVIRLSRALSLPVEDLALAVTDSVPAKASGSYPPPAESVIDTLVARASAIFGWNDARLAQALDVSPNRARRLSHGEVELSASQALVITTLLIARAEQLEQSGEAVRRLLGDVNASRQP